MYPCSGTEGPVFASRPLMAKALPQPVPMHTNIARPAPAAAPKWISPSAKASASLQKRMRSPGMPVSAAVRSRRFTPYRLPYLASPRIRQIPFS